MASNVVQQIRRATRRRFSAEEKIRVVVEGLRGEIGERYRDLLRQIAMAREVTIIRGALAPDHVHMLVAALPKMSSASAGDRIDEW